MQALVSVRISKKKKSLSVKKCGSADSWWKTCCGSGKDFPLSTDGGYTGTETCCGSGVDFLLSTTGLGSRTKIYCGSGVRIYYAGEHLNRNQSTTHGNATFIRSK